MRGRRETTDGRRETEDDKRQTRNKSQDLKTILSFRRSRRRLRNPVFSTIQFIKRQDSSLRHAAFGMTKQISRLEPTPTPPGRGFAIFALCPLPFAVSRFTFPVSRLPKDFFSSPSQFPQQTGTPLSRKKYRSQHSYMCSLASSMILVLVFLLPGFL